MFFFLCVTWEGRGYCLCMCKCVCGRGGGQGVLCVYVYVCVSVSVCVREEEGVFFVHVCAYVCLHIWIYKKQRKICALHMFVIFYICITYSLFYLFL